MRKLCLALVLTTVLASRSFAADVSTAAAGAEPSYAEIKKQFEQDENLEGVRISTFTVTDVTVIYKGRYLVYKMSDLTAAQKPKIDKLIEAEKDRRRTQAL